MLLLFVLVSLKLSSAEFYGVPAPTGCVCVNRRDASLYDKLNGKEVAKLEFGSCYKSESSPYTYSFQTWIRLSDADGQDGWAKSEDMVAGETWKCVLLVDIFEQPVLKRDTRSLTTNSGSYIVTFTNSLRPGVPLGVNVNILSDTRTVLVNVALQKTSGETVSQESENVIPDKNDFNDGNANNPTPPLHLEGMPKLIHLPVPENLLPVTHKIVVSGSGGLTFRNESRIAVGKHNLYILIQTDKGRYSAGQEVKFRVVVTHPDLSLYNGEIDAELMDGKDNKIEVWPSKALVDGMFRGRVQLSEEPVFGTWKLVVKAKTYTEKAVFVVSPYVLPRFSVKVDMADAITPDMTELAITISAIFTFKKKVEGNCTVQLYDASNKQLEFKAQIDGSTTITVPVSSIKSKFGTSVFDLNVRVLVTDKATALTLGSEQKVYIPQTTTVKMSLSDPFKRFIPGLPYFTSAQVSEHQAYWKADVGGKTLRVTATATMANVKSCWNGEKYVIFNKQQIYSETIQLKSDGLANIQFLVGDLAYQVLLTLSFGSRNEVFTLKKFDTNGQHLMRMFPKENPVQVGGRLELTVKSKLVLLGSLHYEVISKGIMVDTGKVTVNMKREETVSIAVLPSMVPRAHVLVYYIGNDNTFLSDSIMVDVKGLPFRNKVDIKFASTTLSPKQNTTIHVTSDPFSKVCLLTVDERVRILQSGNDIDVKKVGNHLARSISSSQDHVLKYKASTGTKRSFSGADESNSRTLEQRRDFDLVGDIDDKLILAGVLFLTDGNLYEQSGPILDSIATMKTTCPPPPVWSNWGSWSSCTKTCGGGTRSRSRSCSVSGYCSGSGVTTVNCNNGQCPSRGWLWSGKPTLFRTTSTSSGGGGKLILHSVSFLQGGGGLKLASFDAVPDGSGSGSNKVVNGGNPFDSGSGDPFDSGNGSPFGDDDEPPPPPEPEIEETKELIAGKFPETWVWTEVETDSTGRGSIQQTVPDSITTWITSYFALNAKSGLAVGETSKVTVKKDFFVTMDLPESIISGEEFLLQITVFNYLTSRQAVYLLIERHCGGVFLPSLDRAMNVESGSGLSTYLNITQSAIGPCYIRVRAKAGGFWGYTAYHSLTKQVLVKPFGVYQEYNVQEIISVSGNEYKTAVEVSDPQTYVQDTKRIRVSITGDIMTPSIDGLHTLLRMPYGCGEQNMLNFAPNVYVTKYLDAVGKLTDAILETALRYMEAGKQREFNYQRTDGSFSAFGNRDSRGSSWLTAFVLKCFHEANDFKMYIDPAKIGKGLSWLLGLQRSDGSFPEPGRVIHKDMQGGSAAGVKLSAYVAISLLENRNVRGYESQITAAASKANSYLERQLPSIRDSYTMALVCNALKLADSYRSNECLQKLKKSATESDGKMYWKASSSVSKRTMDKRSTPQTRAPRADIEATSYALLLYCKFKEFGDAYKIVKWLVSQRNPNGGSSSTQDTVLSLQALSEYSSHVKTSSNTNQDVSDVVDLVISAKLEKHDYQINRYRKDVLHHIDLPGDADVVDIRAVGTGLALVNTIVSYYVAPIEGSSTFTLTTKILKESLNSITVNICSTWKGSGTSGMAVMEVELPTGFLADEEWLKKQSLVKRFEAEPGKAVLYFDEIRRYNTCAQVKSDRSDPVAKSQPCSVVVFDYYEPTNQAMGRYESGILKTSNICEFCPHCNFCHTGGA